MQSSGQYDNVESTALAKEDRADNSDVPKIQRESIKTRRERPLRAQRKMKAYAHLGSFDGKAKFSTWFSRIAINTALTSLRKRHV
jgi:hypothetical protein